MDFLVAVQECIPGNGEKGWMKRQFWEWTGDRGREGCLASSGRKKETTKIIPVAFTYLWSKPNYYTWEKKGFYIAGEKNELICVVFISQKRVKSKQYIGKV